MATTNQSGFERYLATDGPLETRRIALFLAVAMGLSGLTGAGIYATGGLADSPQIVDGLPVTLATVLMATVYMFSPAVANVVTRIATGEGWDDLMLRPRMRAGWRGYPVAWLGTVVLVALGAALYFAVRPGQFAVADQPVALAVGAAVTIGAAVNTVFAFGEEFGWRAYLLPKLRALGDRRAVLLHGVVWGVWHWPVIAMGYNYGLEYPLAPLPGLLAMVVATVGLGGVLAWVTLESGSVWPAALGHGTLNAVGSTTVLFAAGMQTGLLGPAPVGLLAAVPWLVATAVWLVRMDG
jgi:membrane protease YdiL (CAAX protease family)